MFGPAGCSGEGEVRGDVCLLLCTMQPCIGPHKELCQHTLTFLLPPLISTANNSSTAQHTPRIPVKARAGNIHNTPPLTNASNNWDVVVSHVNCPF